MLPEFTGEILVDLIFLGKLDGDDVDVESINRHPACAVSLLEVPTIGQGRVAVKHTDVIETEEASLENVHTLGIFTVDPPGKVQHQFLEDPLQKSAIALPSLFFFDFINPECDPGMPGRIHVTKGQSISGNLAIRMYIPLTQHEDQLFLGTVRINQRQCNAMERKVPGGVPGILPLVTHADYVGVIEMDPCFVAPTGPISER